MNHCLTLWKFIFMKLLIRLVWIIISAANRFFIAKKKWRFSTLFSKCALAFIPHPLFWCAAHVRLIYWLFKNSPHPKLNKKKNQLFSQHFQYLPSLPKSTAQPKMGCKVTSPRDEQPALMFHFILVSLLSCLPVSSPHRDRPCFHKRHNCCQFNVLNAFFVGDIRFLIWQSLLPSVWWIC